MKWLNCADVMFIEKVMFKKVELWLVILLMLLAVIGALLFGGAVRHYLRGGQLLGGFGPMVESIAGFPATVRDVLAFDADAYLVAKEQRFSGQSDFFFNYVAKSRPDLGYVLINRYDGDLGFSVSDLWDLDKQEKVHTWNFSQVDAVWKQTRLASDLVDVPVQMAANRFRNHHAFLDESGNLYVNNGPMVRADSCSVLTLFQGDAIYHHSLEQDSEGNYWVPSHLEPKSVDIGLPGFLDDAVVQVGADGKVLFRKSVVHLLDENGLGYLIYGKGEVNNDPVHLNDIQPVLVDGRHWKKGDLFLSLRHQSMILLYRPSTNKVVWYKQGPWLHQHDVDVISDHEISIFNNKVVLVGAADWVVKGVNEEFVYDFDDDSVRSPWKKGFSVLDIRTVTEGRGEISGDEIFVEESNYGRLVRFGLDGKVAWSYVNRAKNGRVYILNWSRLVSRKLGDQVRLAISARKCQ